MKYLKNTRELVFGRRLTHSKRTYVSMLILICIFFIFTNVIAQSQCVYIPGDVNNNGHVGMSDITYLVIYFKGGAAPPFTCPCPDDPFFAAADVNGSCSVNAIDVTTYVRYLKGLVENIICCPNCPPSSLAPSDGNTQRMASDIGAPDSIIIGNLDRSPIRASPGDTVNLPIWVKNDEAVSSVSIAMATDNQLISQRLGGNLMYPLTSWDDCSFYTPAANTPAPGFTSQSITGWNDLGGGANPFLNTNGAYTQIGEFAMVIDPNQSNIGDTARMSVGIQPRIGEPAFADSSGSDEWNIVPVFSVVVIVNGGCNYIPGDANGNGIFNGIDVGWMVNYFKVTGPPPPDTCYCPPHGVIFDAADANGNCAFNGIDVSYEVNYFKGIGGPPIYCIDCPPAN
jgi:hypothetical protein